ncbi:MAG TPA: hypothetical protein VFA50_22745 [Stellaceae bacterium]|nr:hypothetical protein [Stellaceae bacterium]
MAWMCVRLELARSSDYPAGSHRHGYEFLLPLDDAGHIDDRPLRRAPELCMVHRFWGGAGHAVGTIRRGPGGRWLLSYRLGKHDDEPVPRLADCRFREGEFLTIPEADGDAHTFRIMRVEPASRLAAAPCRHIQPRSVRP